MNGRVLVVDDSRDMRVLAARILRALGERADCVAGGAEALEYLRHERPKLVLLDLMMPEVDGLAVLRAIRSDPRLAGLPVVVFSGAGERELREALAVGADDCLRKGSATIDDFRSRLDRFAPPPPPPCDRPEQQGGGRRADA